MFDDNSIFFIATFRTSRRGDAALPDYRRINKKACSDTKVLGHGFTKAVKSSVTNLTLVEIKNS